MADISKGYINIQGWMRTELGLKGSELIAFALIYGFSQDGATMFYGSYEYISEWLGLSRASTIGVITRLCEKGFIKKVVMRKGNAYFANHDKTACSQEPAEPHVKAEKQATFKAPSVEEVAEYFNESAYDFDHREEAEKFVDYWEMHGWEMKNGRKMKDWKAAARTWAKNVGKWGISRWKPQNIAEQVNGMFDAYNAKREACGIRDKPDEVLWDEWRNRKKKAEDELMEMAFKRRQSAANV